MSKECRFTEKPGPAAGGQCAVCRLYRADGAPCPDGTAENAEEECERYHNVIESMGGIDLQLLGIGNNGHIGFNEPSDIFETKVHKVELTESTIQANSRLFDSIDDVPRYAYTMGIGEIKSAKQILIVASGKAKAPIVKELI